LSTHRLITDVWRVLLFRSVSRRPATSMRCSLTSPAATTTSAVSANTLPMSTFSLLPSSSPMCSHSRQTLCSPSHR
jgi:hypothetical protein